MKMKRILLVTFLLLAVLTIGAASAEDNNATSDDLQVADDGDDVVELSGYDEDEHSIDVYYDDEIDLEDDEESVADICLPYNTQKGSFRVYNGNNQVARLDIDFDDDHWDNDDEENILNGYLCVGDLTLSKIHDGDNLTFKFFEFKSGSYVEDVRFTVVYGVSITGSTMVLNELDPENEAEIQINNIDLSKPDENFTYVFVTKKEGTFIITVSAEDEDVVFKEDLNTTGRKYVKYHDNEYDIDYYQFGFSLTDINNYISQNIPSANSLIDLVNVSSDVDIYFEVYEDEDNEDSDIASEERIVTIENGKILFGEELVDVDYGKLDVVMREGWQKDEIIEFTVKGDTSGKIIIYLNDNETPAFEKKLSDYEPEDYDPDEDEEFDFTVTVGDLKISQVGQYLLRVLVNDEQGSPLYRYDEEDPEILTLYVPQIAEGENATIDITPVPMSFDGEDETVITIIATDDGDDNVTVYVDGNDAPLIFKLAGLSLDDDENYIITSKKLNLGVGKHTLNVICKGTSLVGNVNVTSDLVIDLAEDIVYTNMANNAFVFISLEEKDIIGSSDIIGLLNVTITDSEGNVISTLHKDIEDGMNAIEEFESYVIYAKEMDVDLNGTYTVSVIYYNGNKGIIQIEGNVTFKELGGDDYGLTINDAIVDDNIITFDDIPFEDYNILVEIDGNRSVTFNKSSLNERIEQGNKLYSIKQDQLNLTDGPHLIKVSIENDLEIIELANVNVTVDLKENADPALTVSVANIEVGNAATVLITTNSSFTGNVKVQVANKTYDVNVTNGQGNVSVTGLDVGEYIATATFEADAFFNASVKTAAFNVTAKPVTPAKEDTKPVAKKTKVKLTLKKVKVKRSAKKLVLTATLKINGKAAKKKKITFKFKGKKYKAKTNKKGVAKVTIKKKVLKKLKKGKKVKIQASYGKTVKKYTVKVRK